MIRRPGGFQAGAAIAGALTPLNSSIIAVALPQVRADFGVGVAEATLLVSAYLIAVAVAQPVAGRAGDAFGHERMICLGLVGTIILSLVAAAAWTFPVLVVARIVQGAAAALVAANVMAAIRARTPVERLGSVLGRQGAAITAGAAIGPLAGGLFLSLGGWRWLFIGSMVPSVVALAMLIAFARPKPVVRAAFSLFLSTQAALLVFFTGLTGLGIAIRYNSLPGAFGSIAAAILAAAAYGLVYRKKRTGVVDLSLFTNRNYAAAAIATATGNLVFYTIFISIPAFVEDVRGGGHEMAALLLFSGSIASVIGSPIAGRTTDRLGAHRVAGSGGVIILAGIGWLTFATWQLPLYALVPGMALISLGVTVAGTGQQSAALAAWPPTRAGAVSGAFSMMRYVGSITGAAIAVAILGESPDEFAYVVLMLALGAVAVANMVTVLFLRPMAAATPLLPAVTPSTATG